MKVDGGISADLDQTVSSVKEAEEAGYDGVWTAETSHDPFFPLVLAAEHSERVALHLRLVPRQSKGRAAI